jgi:hypothetical protein
VVEKPQDIFQTRINTVVEKTQDGFNLTFIQIYCSYQYILSPLQKPY